jgi:hypothetical protein
VRDDPTLDDVHSKHLENLERTLNKRVRYLVIAVWCFFVAPMATLGYGSDGDAWRVARTAKAIWTAKQYSVSRSTGFPIFELLATPLVMAGKWYLSNLIALISGIAVIAALLRLARKGQLHHPILSIVGISFLPVITANASATMDYVPALALLLWAYVLTVERRWTPAAILVGVACGFRPTSGLFIIPVAIYTYLESRHISATLKALGLALLFGILAYSPVLLRYGIILPLHTATYGLTTRLLITGYNLVTLFGIIQTAVVCAALIPAVRSWMGSRSADSFLTFHFVNILIWVSLFLVMGDEPEYLIPIVPSIILILDRTLSKRRLAAVIVLLLSYSVIQFDVLGGESGKRTAEPRIRFGYDIVDVQDRLFKLSTRAAATRYVALRNTVLMYGRSWIPVSNDGWVYDEEHAMYRQREGSLFVSDRILDLERLKELSESDFRLVVWRGEKWDYVRGNLIGWQDYVEVVDDLSDFFGVKLRGRASNQR